MGRAAVLVDPTSLAIQSTFTKNLKYPEDKTPLSGQSLILLSRWLECAPKYRLRSILKKLCEEQAIADEVFVAMTARDVEIAERELLESGECPDYHPSCLDLIREQNERELANIIFNNGASTSTGSTRGDLVIAEALKQKEIADDGAQTGGVARKRKAKDHNSDAEESDDEEYESDHPCGAVHKRVKIGHGGIILKEKKRMKSVESLDNASSKHDHCKIAKCKNCNEAYDLCFKDAACQYHPCVLEINRSYSGWDAYDIYTEDEWEQLDDVEFHDEQPDGFSFPCCDGRPQSKGCKKGVHIPAPSRAVSGGGVLSEKNA